MTNSAEYWVVSVYSALAVTGLLGNIWVMLTVLSQLFGCCQPQSFHSRTSKPVVQCSASVYLLILSVVDLLSILPVPLLATDILYNEWPFGVLPCKLYFFCESANKSVSPLVLTALSVDRYIAVCRPTLVWLRQCKFAVLVLLACFAVSLFFIFPVLYLAEVHEMADANFMEHPKCVLQMPHSFDLLHVFACYLFPLSLICSVYIGILHRLYEHTRRSSVGRRTSISLSRVVKCSVLVVAFYFICWTPYWALRLAAVLSDAHSYNTSSADSYSNASATAEMPRDDYVEVPEEGSLDVHDTAQVVVMYLVHALPYAQSAFNWLFYAFLNRNLRLSSSRCSTAIRSAAFTSTFFDNIHVASASGSSIPLWRNIQLVGSHLRNASADTSNLLLNKSPFRIKSRVRSRSSTFLDSTTNDVLSSTNVHFTSNGGNVMSSSAVDVGAPKTDLALLSATPLPSLEARCSPTGECVPSPEHSLLQSSSEFAPQKRHSAVSEGSSVEWL